jgi:multicomponent Na+:H+ antiporter subunit F
MTPAAFQLGVAAFLLLTVLAGLWRVLRGPDPADRLMAAQLFGTTVVAILLLLAEALATPALRHAGLVFASLGAVTIAAYVRFRAEAAPGEHDAS